MDFNNIKTIAVVGLSSNTARPSHEVAKYLQKNGFRVIPVNPAEQEILGEKCYPDVQSIPAEIAIDVVDIFRRSEDVLPIVQQALSKNPKYVVLQEGVINEEAKELAEKAGIKVKMDKCIKKIHMFKQG